MADRSRIAAHEHDLPPGNINIEPATESPSCARAERYAKADLRIVDAPRGEAEIDTFVGERCARAQTEMQPKARSWEPPPASIDRTDPKLRGLGRERDQFADQPQVVRARAEQWRLNASFDSRARVAVGLLILEHLKYGPCAHNDLRTSRPGRGRP